MKKWEYMFLDSHINEAMHTADEFGKEGWEMVTAQLKGADVWYMIFKRHIPEKVDESLL